MRDLWEFRAGLVGPLTGREEEEDCVIWGAQLGKDGMTTPTGTGAAPPVPMSPQALEFSETT